MSWRIVTDVAGNMHNLYFQEFRTECGPSCVAMVVRAVRSTLLDISQARTAVEQSDVFRGSKVDRQGRRFFLADLTWEQDPSNIRALTQALSSFQITTAYTLRGLGNALLANVRKRTSPMRPGIVHIKWQRGGGHFAVTVGTVGGTYGEKVVLLDPWYGLQHIPVGVFPVYKPVASPSMHAGRKGNGTVSPMLVTTS